MINNGEISRIKKWWKTIIPNICASLYKLVGHSVWSNLPAGRRKLWQPIKIFPWIFSFQKTHLIQCTCQLRVWPLWASAWPQSAWGRSPGVTMSRSSPTPGTTSWSGPRGPPRSANTRRAPGPSATSSLWWDLNRHYYHDGTVINPAESRYTIYGKDPCLTVGLVIVTTHTSPLSLISEPGAQAARPGGPTCQLVTRCISLAFSQPAQRSKHFSKLKLRNLIKLKSCPYFVKRIFMSRSQRNIWCSSDAPSKRIFCLADDKRGHAEGEKFWRFLW